MKQFYLVMEADPTHFHKCPDCGLQRECERERCNFVFGLQCNLCRFSLPRIVGWLICLASALVTVFLIFQFFKIFK
ncbi:MAG TPA: hypothetical protein VF596_18770 [Pyrinomonadaceae bacterium]|jgi:hypothetical protein